MKTRTDLINMPAAEHYGYLDGFDDRECRNIWTREPTNERAAAEYKRGYDAGIADRANAEQVADDLVAELATQKSAIGRG